MRNILEPEHVWRITKLAQHRALLAFDFDGTLAPIVDQPDAAGITQKTAERLRAVTCLYPVAIISGRAVDDVRARLLGVKVAAIVGNHGIEPSHWMTEAADAVTSWVPTLAEGVAGIEGVRVENKRHSLAVHYRHARSQSGAYRAIREAVERLPADARIMDGHKVVNVVPAGAPTKGDALLHIAAQSSLDAILFAGDDVTDEDAFAVLNTGDSLGIRVCPAEQSRAAWYIPSQVDIDLLLAELLRVRG